MYRKEFEEAATNAVLESFNRANQYFETDVEMVSIKFNQRGSAAGTAYLQRHEVRFNYDMYLQNPNEFLSTVVPHEIAHIFVYQLFGPKVRPHGKEWKSVMMNVFNLAPNRTHNFDVKAPAKSFLYLCDCMEHALTIRRHNRILKGAEYQCRKCRAKLREK